MCPACITTALLTAVGASSTGGLTALALKKLCWKSKRNHQTEETRGEQNENRSNATQENSNFSAFTDTSTSCQKDETRMGHTIR
jgi:hypothetical protein